MTVKFTNNASTTVATGINTTATSLIVASAAGFPALSGSGDYCYLTIQQAAGTNVEVVKATALSSNTFTIVRAQDGTSAGSWSVSDVVELRVTAALLTDIVDAATHDNSVLAVDSTNNRVGVNDTTPSVTLDISGTDAIALPVGTTAERPTGAAGRFRYNSSLSQFEGYTDAWGAIGGGGTNTFTTDSFTANGSLVAFNLSQTVASENNLLVFIDGVFQTQDAYAIATASGTTTLTFSAAPANGRKIVVYSVAAGISGTNLNVDSMTGDGSDVTLTLTINTIKENTQVFIDGVYQAKANYSISGTTLTFSTAPPAGSAVECVTMTQTEINVPVDNTITSAKLSGDLTTPGALTVTGEITANGGIALGDNDKATFGAGDDLEIFHDGSNSYISDTGDGSLYLRGSNQVRIESATGEKYFIANVNADTNLYYDNSAKLATTSTGIDVTGRAVVDGLTSSASILGTSNSNSLGGTTFTSSISTVGLSSSAAITSTSNSNSLGGTSFTGSVGIGTSSLTAGLTVSGTGVGAAIDWTNTTASTGRSYRWVSLNNGTGFALEDLTAGSERLRIGSGGQLTSSVAGGYFETRADGGGFNYKQTLDVATAGLSITGQSNRGDLATIRLYQTATGVDGGYIRFDTSPSGSTTPTERMRISAAGVVTKPYQPAFGVSGNVYSGAIFRGGAVHSNVGGHFNTTTGIFTAPVAGTYSFMFSLSTQDTQSHFVDIFINGLSSLGHQLIYGVIYNTGSQSINITLAALDTVSARKRGSSYATYNATFSGHLIG